jgi:uncharacterized membrane protein
VSRSSDRTDREDVSDDVDRRVRNVELLISRLLRGGVVSSLVVVILGTVVTFAHHRSYFSSSSDLDALTDDTASFPHDLAAVAHGVAHFNGPAIVVAGLLLLIATPVIRVAISIAAFRYQSDRTFTVITSIVFTLLVVSFVLGRVE